MPFRNNGLRFGFAGMGGAGSHTDDLRPCSALPCSISGSMPVSTTILFSAVNEARTQYAAYLAELVPFLAHYGLAPGSAQAIPAVAERMAQDPSFRDDLGSMLTVICAQEPGMTYLELLGLVLVAAAGPAGSATLAADPTLEEPSRQLFNFVMDLRRSMQAEVAEPVIDPAGDAAWDSESPEALATPPEPPSSAEAGRSVPPVTTAPATFSVASSAAAVPGAASAAGKTSILARALAISADEEVLGRSSAPSPEPLKPVIPAVEAPKPASSAPELTVPFAALEPAVPRGSSRRNAWVMGLCGLLLGLLLGLLIQRRPAASSERSMSANEEGIAAPEGTAAALPKTRMHGPGAAPRGSSEPRSASEREYWDTRSGQPGSARTARSGVNSEFYSRASSPNPAADAPASVASTSERTAPAARYAFSGPRPPAVSEVHLGTAPDPVTTGSSSTQRPRSGRVVLGSAGIMAANLVSSPAPAYPARASAAQVQGEVIIEAIVGKDGDVIDTRVVSGPPLLRDAAVSAVQRWRYRPYEVDGKPAEIATTARVEFKLDSN